MNTNTYTPSKELLSEVFNTTVKNIELDRGQTEVKIYRENTSCLGTYNIYELVHKCKEWALNKNYEISPENGKRIFQKKKVVYTSNYEINKVGENVYIDEDEYIVNFI